MRGFDFIQLLGTKQRDKVTRFTGVVSTVAYDLYGCIQVALNPGLKPDGTLADSAWFDVNRLEPTGEDRVMDVPNYESGPIAEANQGAAEKPRMTRA